MVRDRKQRLTDIFLLMNARSWFTAFRGELTSHHPHFHPDSPAACHDVDLKTAQSILPGGFTVGLHMGTWHKPGEEYNAQKMHDNIKYSADDDEAIDNWISGNRYSERDTNMI